MSEEQQIRPYRVLSIDGGGVRGLYTAVLLYGLAKRIAAMQQRPEDRLDIGGAFDLIVGTSTGAILATALAAGVALEDIIALYKGHASKIFSDPTPSEKWPLLKWAYRHKDSAANPADALKSALQNVLHEETVEQMYKRRNIALCVPAVDIESQKAWVFKTPHDKVGNRLQRDNHYRLVDVCLASAAAPLILPIHGIEKPGDASGNINWFVDGGLWANNPVLVALIEALSFAPPNSPIQIISVSTCPPFTASAVTQGNSNRGLLGWTGGIKMLEASLDAQSWAYDYIAKTLTTLNGSRVNYTRLTDPDVNGDEAKELKMDNPSEACLSTLVKLGNRAVDLNFSEATTGQKPKALLLDVLANLPSLPKGEIDV